MLKTIFFFLYPPLRRDDIMTLKVVVEMNMYFLLCSEAKNNPYIVFFIRVQEIYP
jgi:hypothetical protein